MNHNIIIKDGNTNSVVKEVFLVDGVQFVDDDPVEGSNNLARSGSVAETNKNLSTQSSNIAEDFSASSPYAIGEVVLGPDGRLYQCTTAIETGGDWDPTYWTRTTVAKMMAGNNGYTETSEEIALNSDTSLDIGEREIKKLRVAPTGAGRTLTLKCSNDCIVRIYAAGQDFSLILEDSAGNPLDAVVQYPFELDKEYTYVDDGEVEVIQEAYLRHNRSLSGLYGYIRVTGHVALVIWSEDSQ